MLRTTRSLGSSRSSACSRALFVLGCCAPVGLAAAQEAVLVPSNAQVNALTGHSVAISEHHAVVGARDTDGAASNEGAAWVFERIGTSWTQKAQLQPLDGMGAGAHFGTSVRIDGDRIAVSSYYVSSSIPVPHTVGGVWIFERNGDAWPQTAYVVPPPGTSNAFEFGGMCALSGDTLLVAQGGDSTVLPHAGSVVAFERVGGVWTSNGTIVAETPAADARFGRYVYVSGDHALALAVGVPGYFGFTSERVGGVWTPAKPLMMNGEPAHCLSGAIDGDRIAVMGYPSPIPDLLTVNVFSFDGTNWVHEASVNGIDQQPSDNYGQKIALHRDRLAVHSGLAVPNHVRFFDRIQGAWKETGKVTVGSKLYTEGLSLFGDRFIAEHTLLAPKGGADVHYVPTLASTNGTVSASTGGSQLLHVSTNTPSFTGKLRLLLGSASGTTPGLAAGAYTLPLNLDGYLLFTLGSPNQAPLSNSFGVVDASGDALATFSVPAGADPALVGVVANHAFVVIDPLTLGVEWASNPVLVRIIP